MSTRLATQQTRVHISQTGGGEGSGRSSTQAGKALKTIDVGTYRFVFVLF